MEAPMIGVSYQWKQQNKKVNAERTKTQMK